MSQKTEQKQKSREAILLSAASLMRERGITASSVQDVMRGAGLTVGGFYNHFESKEHLFTETIQAGASMMWDRLISSARGEAPIERARDFVKQYLSRAHRDHAEAGCLLPTVAPEVAREGEPYRSALEAQLSGFVQSFSALLAPGTSIEKRERALGLIALMYGALSLSRAVQGTALSDEFLKAAKKLAEHELSKE